jgi:peptidoglycan/LPS O-acetylase OafA/YrhL
VDIFFVISGYLITALLLREHDRTGTISFRAFYTRRIKRIIPASVLVLISTVVAAWFLLDAARFGQLLRDAGAAMLFFANWRFAIAGTDYFQEGLPPSAVQHFWSLAVEEQFYLLWPFLLKYLGVGRATRLALATVIAAPLLRFGLLVGAPSFRPGIGETFPTVADAIATGCLLACLRDRIPTSPRLMALLQGRTFWLIPAVAIVCAFMPGAKIDALAGQTITNVGIALAIERFVRFPATPFARFLNARPVVFVGVLSYSLYLWQQPFLNRHSGTWMTAFPVNLGLAFAAALGSYYLIERPALRLRARLEGRTRVRAPEPPQGAPAG